VISIIVAYAGNRVIGRDGALPWHLPSDLRRFRELTSGHAVVMGRRTFESLPDAYRPLPKRRNLVLSTSAGYEAGGAEVFDSLESALHACGRDCFVIGGSAAYEQALEVADRLYVTHVAGEPEGDAYFPSVCFADWCCVEEQPPLTENGQAFQFRVYERAAATALYHLPAARTEQQRDYMRQLEASRTCIFCPAHVATHHREPIEIEGEHWYVTKNDYPYAGTRAHYLIVPRRHVTSFHELPDDAGRELWAMKRALKELLAPLAVATIERSGDMRFNGGSVAHLHTHFVALDAEPQSTVRFRVSAPGPQ
jgi:dihydrofolate reductase/diadenosine tetraphosphate (Ap4A) HIT family hydrolase